MDLLREHLPSYTWINFKVAHKALSNLYDPDVIQIFLFPQFKDYAQIKLNFYFCNYLS